MTKVVDKTRKLGYNETATPYPVYEDSSGYLCVFDGNCRQIICRFQEGKIFVWWKKGKTEVELTLDDFLEGYLASKK